MSELKPIYCNCGGKPEIIDVEYHSEMPTAKMVICRKCGIRTDLFDTELDAVDNWNTAMGAKDIYVPERIKWIADKLRSEDE